MKVWIDLSNSPHPLLFAPIVRRLEADGDEVFLTARDNAQTVALARERWPHVDVLGQESPGGRWRKALVLACRVGDLRAWAVRRRPDVALSHNSYAQIVAARSLQVPTVTAMDFEHQLANHLAFRLANRVLVPEQLAAGALRRQGATRKKVTRYPGVKEELYAADFEPDPTVLSAIGVERQAGDLLVVARTPPTRALYHQFGNPLFTDALRAVTKQPNAICVVLVRHAEQAAALTKLRLPRCVIPREAIDARSLMYQADLVLGGGGTMTREAAVLGVPAYSLFAGERPAVDRWLEGQGMLRTIRTVDELDAVRPALRRPLVDIRRRADEIEQVFVATLREAVEGAT